ncbi:ABC transporter permease [Kitasatospora sp. NBC_01250]|uniref:ABC transporter permease n=1 Tax=Kitasatospora sp. NBC_01250 TaxID=2903571 RepID=UPI002E3343D9|nr:ABC transporter permease [Kitasatospora sp. NBC_01250]
MSTTLNAPAAPAGILIPEARRIGPIRLMRHTAALTWRIITQVRHNPEPLFLLGVQPILFLLLSTYIYGGEMAGSSHAYLQYEVPGMMGYNAVFATMAGAPALFGDVGRGVFDRFRSMPIARTAPLLARYCGDLMLQMWALVLVLGVGFALGFRIMTHWWNLGFAVLLLAAFSFGLTWLAMAIGLSVRSVETVQMLSFLCTIPLSFISGAFAEPKTMPGWLQVFVKLNPVTWLGTAERGVLLGGAVARPVCYTLLSSAVVGLLFAPLALRGLARRR